MVLYLVSSTILVVRITMMSSRGIIGCSAVAVLLATLGAAVEVYDDSAPDNLDTYLAYQEDNDLDTGPVDEQTMPSLRNVMLYKMIKAMRPHKQTWFPLQYKPDWQKTDGLPSTDVKDSVFKRLPDSTKNKIPPIVTRPQPKWKIKKGKAIGSQLVCYFKLCAFRSPS